MRLFSIRSKILRYLVCYVVALSAILAPYEASALYEGVRNTRFSGEKCDLTDGNKNLAFDPFGNNVDYQFDFGNPHCQSLAAASITPVLALYMAMKIGCKYAVFSLCPPNPAVATTEDAEDTASGPITPAPSPNWAIKQFIYAKGCSTRLANNSACCANATTCASSTLDASLCCGGLISFTAGITTMLIALAAVHGKANYAYEQAKICGTGWYSWKQLGSDGNESSSGIWTKVKGPKQLCIRHLFLGESGSSCTGDSNRVITNKLYREYMYGGIEYEDDDECRNPKTWSDDRKLQILGYTSNKQRYYMTGPGSAPVYACHRFLASAKAENEYDATQDQAAMQEAYDCCKKRSQQAICIESRGGSKDAGGTVTGKTDEEYKFCNIGDTSCHVGYVDYEIYQSSKTPNYICAKTFSVCPYNHLLGGGTEERKTDVKGNAQNFCQYLYHCSKMPILPYIRTSNMTGAHIDSSCRDLKGDTQNVFGYTAELLPINTRGFTAPIVQCIKETMQNTFLNNAGYTKCSNPDETPDQYDQCPSGEEFRKGEQMQGDSFFAKLQKKFQVLIRIILTLSVTLYGAMLLFAAPGTKVERKSIFPYILKIALIAYFTLGNAWQAVFVKDILNASSYLAAITFKPDDPTLGTNKLDGCQFPRFDHRQTEESVEKYYPVDGSGTRDDSKLSYPPGKEYLQVWDMLDCKIALSLGFGPEVSVPNLIFMILGGFITAGYGLLFVIAALSFAFFMIFIAIRTLQFFLVSMIAIVLLLYLSVFIIPLLLFEKTKSIFSGWWKQLLSFVLQPMILFAYLGVLIAIFDNVVMGSATFSPATVTINGTKIVDDYGRVSPKTISCNSAAQRDSVYCIFRVADIKTYNGLEAIGVAFPILDSMSWEKLMTLVKGALIMFIFSKFMDNINTIASELTNGTKISTNWGATPSEMAQKAFDTLKGVQDRGKRALLKASRAGFGAAASAANAIGNKGKKSAAKPAAKPADKKKPVSDEVGSSKKDSDNAAADEAGSSKKDSDSAADEAGDSKKDSDSAAADEAGDSKKGSDGGAADEAGDSKKGSDGGAADEAKGQPNKTEESPGKENPEEKQPSAESGGDKNDSGAEPANEDKGSPDKAGESPEKESPEGEKSAPEGEKSAPEEEKSAPEEEKSAPEGEKSAPEEQPSAETGGDKNDSGAEPANEDKGSPDQAGESSEGEKGNSENNDSGNANTSNESGNASEAKSATEVRQSRVKGGAIKQPPKESKAESSPKSENISPAKSESSSSRSKAKTPPKQKKETRSRLHESTNAQDQNIKAAQAQGIKASLPSGMKNSGFVQDPIPSKESSVNATKTKASSNVNSRLYRSTPAQDQHIKAAQEDGIKASSLPSGMTKSDDPMPSKKSSVKNATRTKNK